MDWIPNRIDHCRLGRRTENPTGSAKNRVVQFTNWEILKLYELGEIVQNRWMPSVLQNTHLREQLKAHLVNASCRRGNREKIRTQFEVVSVPHYLAGVDYSRGAEHGENQWQYDHWQARDAEKGATKHKRDSIELRRKNDDIYRASQTFHGWTQECCRYLDHHATIDISTVATWKQRSRDEKSLVLGVNDGPHPRPMRGRNDFQQTAPKLAALQRQQGRVVPCIPKRLREQQRAFDEQLRSELEWQVRVGKSIGRRHSSHLQQSGGYQENGTNHNKDNCKISNGGKCVDCSLLSNHHFFCKNLAHTQFFFRVQTSANVVHASGSEARTPHRMHRA